MLACLSVAACASDEPLSQEQLILGVLAQASPLGVVAAREPCASEPLLEGCPARDELALRRQSCAFGEGARVAESLGIEPERRRSWPIEHVIVLMKENRSFDHLFARLHDQGQSLTEPLPAEFSNLDMSAERVSPSRAETSCFAHDPDHQWDAMHLQVNQGAMNGFVLSAADSTRSDGHFVMRYYTREDLPFYHFIASTYALNDRHFPSARSGTYPNRNFMLLGTADGVRSTGAGYPDPATRSLFDALDDAGISWGAYIGSRPFDGTLGWRRDHRGVGSLQDFFHGLDEGSLPSVSFVDGRENIEDEHPKADVQVGEAWTRRIYQRAVHSPLWSRLAIIWTYDEAGGFADHVAPPEQACVARPLERDQPFTELGVRVPLVVISPWARAHYVSHVVQEHTAVTRFIEALFDLPALTARDANSDALLDMFDFEHGPQLLEPPEAPDTLEDGCDQVER